MIGLIEIAPTPAEYDPRFSFLHGGLGYAYVPYAKWGSLFDDLFQKTFKAHEEKMWAQYVHEAWSILDEPTCPKRTSRPAPLSDPASDAVDAVMAIWDKGVVDVDRMRRQLSLEEPSHTAEAFIKRHLR